MDKSIARIVKRGDKWCVVSEDGTKNLGCSKTKEGAQERLRQVEYFKHTKGQNMDFEQAFKNIAKSLTGKEINPTEIGKSQDTRPNLVAIPSDSITEGFSSGSIAGQPSIRLLDKKDHFPVFTETQARSSISRAWQLAEVPVWYNGRLDDLRRDVFEGILKAHPKLAGELNVNVPASHIVALSDGLTPSETKVKTIDNPADVQKSLVPGTKRPTITTAEVVKLCEDNDTRIAIAGKLMECIEQQEEDLMQAKKIASTLLKKGVSPEQFNVLNTYLQSDILRELIYQTNNCDAASASEERRLTLLARLKPEQKND